MSSIKLENVTIDYIKGGKLTSLKTFLNPKLDAKTRARLKGRIFRGLDSINLEAKDGDRIGLIGPNGAGKSTLLRVISGIYRPTAGEISINGSVSSLLTHGVGLNLEANGYDNIILLGVIHGRNKKYMRTRFKDIEEFSELGPHLRDPVRTYSNGMVQRLIFSTLTSIPHDILLMDEGIGAGDDRFIQRAKERLNNMLSAANIVIVASHAEHIINSICNKVLLINHGRIVYFGEPTTGFQIYQRDILKIAKPKATADAPV